MRIQPSEHFIGAIMRAYEKEKAGGHAPSCSGIWDRICIECLQDRLGFQMMFAWDTSKAKNKNRIGTIMETIKAGYVPGLRIGQDAKGRAIVVEAVK